MIKKALIVTAETNLDFRYYDDFYIIGVERGCLDLIRRGMRIDLAVADFDHVIDEELGLIKQHAKEFKLLNNEKDHLDGEVAIRTALELGCTEIIMVVKPTKRYDMNMSTFDFAMRYPVKIMSETGLMFKLKSGKNILSYQRYQDFTYVSFFAKRRTVISITGLYYEANDLVLNPFETKAMSNCFKRDIDGVIEVSTSLICVLQK